MNHAPAAPDDADRLAREAAFHNARFGEDMSRDAQEKYYWAVKDGRAAFNARVRTLAAGGHCLEYGCATGEWSAEIAPLAARFSGIDISPVAIGKAQALVPGGQFSVMNAEEMTFADDTFDLIYGAGIIHHLDVEKAAKDVWRVLRPGGKALFWEPLGHNLLINAYRALTPKARTPDEHPLLKRDIQTLKTLFGDVSQQHYGLTTIAGVPFRNSFARNAVWGVTRMLDRGLLAVPGLQWQAWYTTLELTKPAD